MIDYNYIKAEVIRNGYTVTSLANKIDINVNTLSRWINGNNLNQIEKFLMVLVLLHIDINKILSVK
jgi:transcriptional regulator with XRE-family HTH domain